MMAKAKVIRDGTFVYINWRDKRQVNMIASIHNGSSFEKKVRCKPGEGNGNPFKFIQKPLSYTQSKWVELTVLTKKLLMV